MLYVLPETAGDIVVVQATGQLTAEDYQNDFLPLLNEKLEQFGAVRVLIYLDRDFTGWTAGALWKDARFGLAHRNDFKRLAIVGDARWLDWAALIGEQLISGECRHFAEREFLQALHWIDGAE
ncbi:SpoIIAA family protein [Marinobacterium arenosum]|uniref:STAS/SEC14 domain-containing protein n=1 Tax=Marinobacterium arenosum TaxID=2862496 RepID=UPI001C95F981|nr:STAS/SEC14 domain-containing protein [Marinobacterium arenosum]MBY4675106.1 STAS/SEC14 domain-containing protein [Marinobacterium arenosum]